MSGSPPSEFRSLRDRATLQPLFTFARGGMGTVELAALRKGGFARLIVIKRLHEHLAAEPDLVACFLAEARFAGLLRDPHVVSVLELGRDAVGPFLMMDYVDGVSCARLIQRCNQLQFRLPVQLCVRIAADAARGLHAAHTLVDLDLTPLALLHRDVSPQNILIGFDGSTKVADFGVAKVMDSTNYTQFGPLRGRLGYMPPERLRYEPYGAAADIFALGVVLHELLTGTRLYGGSDAEGIVKKILTEPAPDLGLERDDAPPSLVELLFETLAKDAALRPASALDLAQRLEAVLAELVRDEGLLSPAEWLNELFADERVAFQLRIKQCLQTPLSLAPQTSESFAALPVAADSELFAHPGSDSPHAWGTRRKFALSALLAAVALAAVAFEPTHKQVAAAPRATSLASTDRTETETEQPTSAHSTAAHSPITSLPDRSSSTSHPPPPSDSPATVPARSHLLEPTETRLDPLAVSKAKDASATQPADCTDPFYFDVAGRRRVKRQCF